jgi:hypothetical protein
LVGVTLAGTYQAFPYLEPFDKDDWDAWTWLIVSDADDGGKFDPHSFS